MAKYQMKLPHGLGAKVLRRLISRKISMIALDDTMLERPYAGTTGIHHNYQTGNKRL
jgi:hypothetical protein